MQDPLKGPLATSPEDAFPPQGEGESNDDYQKRLDEARAEQATIAERAAAGEADEDTPELFPSGVLDGDKITPQNILKKAKDGVQLVARLSAHELPLRQGLFDPNKQGRAIVHFLPGKKTDEPVRGGAGDDVTQWKIVQKLDVYFAEPAGDEAALITKEFQALLELDASKAATLLDELRALAGEELRQAA